MHALEVLIRDKSIVVRDIDPSLLDVGVTVTLLSFPDGEIACALHVMDERRTSISYELREGDAVVISAIET